MIEAGEYWILHGTFVACVERITTSADGEARAVLRWADGNENAIFRRITYMINSRSWRRLAPIELLVRMSGDHGD